VSNYHWYLKQRLEFASCCHGNVSALMWDPELAYCLHVALDAGHYLQFTWTWTTNHSAGQTSHDLASVAVIDGGKWPHANMWSFCFSKKVSSKFMTCKRPAVSGA